MDKLKFGQEAVCLDPRLLAEIKLFMEFVGIQKMIHYSIVLKKI
jgi:hypothetical protein